MPFTVSLPKTRSLEPLAGVAGTVLAVAFDKDLWDPVNLGTPQVGNGFSAGEAQLLEAVMTFFLTRFTK